MSAIEIHYNVDLRGLCLVMLVVQIIYLAHCLACAWHLVADLSGQDGTVATWTTTFDGGTAADPETPVGVKYLYSLYWSLTTLTTVGYGDVTPANDTERAFTCMVLLLGALVFGYMIGNVSAMMAQLTRQENEIRDRMDAVKDYVAWRNMPPELAVRIKTYCAYYYSTRPGAPSARSNAVRRMMLILDVVCIAPPSPAAQRVSTSESSSSSFHPPFARTRPGACSRRPSASCPH